MQTSKKPPWSNPVRPCRMLCDAEDRAVSIRKLLCQEIGPASVREPGMRDDAVNICLHIERLCARGKKVSAEDVADYCQLVEKLLDELARLLSIILASRRKHAVD